MKRQATRRATELLDADPELSDNTIAAEVGIAAATVRRLRQKIPGADVDVRIGINGRLQRVRGR